MTDDIEHGQSPPLPSNPAAFVSVVTGLLLCIPAAGIIAVPSGLIGVRKARKIGGIGLAPARFGLVLGIINLVWWAALIGGAFNTYLAFKHSQPVFEPTKKFIMLIGSGDVNAAKALCTDAIDTDKLTASAEQIQQWGVIEKIDVMFGGEYHSQQDIEVNAELKFDKITKYLVAHWAMIDGSPRLTAYEFRDPPTTQSTTQNG